MIINAFKLYLSVCNLQFKFFKASESAVNPWSPMGFSLRSSSVSVKAFAVRAEAKITAPFSVIPQNANL